MLGLRVALVITAGYCTCLLISRMQDSVRLLKEVGNLLTNAAGNFHASPDDYHKNYGFYVEFWSQLP